MAFCTMIAQILMITIAIRIIDACHVAYILYDSVWYRSFLSCPQRAPCVLNGQGHCFGMYCPCMQSILNEIFLLLYYPLNIRWKRSMHLTQGFFLPVGIFKLYAIHGHLFLTVLQSTDNVCYLHKNATIYFGRKANFNSN